MVQLGFEKAPYAVARVGTCLVGAGLTIGRDCEQKTPCVFVSVHDLV